MGLIQKIFGRGEAEEKLTLANPPQNIGYTIISGTEARSNRYSGPKAGTAALLDIYSKSPWLHSVVEKISVAVAGTTWRLYVTRNQNSGKIFRNSKIQFAQGDVRGQLLKRAMDKDELEEIVEHPLLDLLRMGNLRNSGENVFQIIQTSYELTGEAFLVMERNLAGVPAALYPLPPHWILEFPSREYPAYRVLLDSYTYDIPASEVIAVINPDPLRPYERGAGIGRSLGDELETEEFLSKHLKNFFYNRARPDIIISADGLSPENTKRLEENWVSKHRGFWNSFKPTFLSRKVEVTELGQSMQDLQMKELRINTRDTMLQVFGVPPEKWGVLSASNRSTIVAADVFWTKDVLRPRIERQRTVFQRNLVPEFDENLILDYESPVVEDKEFNLDVMKAHPGAFTINEWREAAGEPGLGEDGEYHVLGSGESYFPTGDPPSAEDLASEPADSGNSASEDGKSGIEAEMIHEIRNRALKVIRERNLALTS